MNDERRHELLAEIYHPDGRGPSLESVLGRIRQERSARKRRRNVAGAMAAMCLAAGLALWPKTPVKEAGREGMPMAAVGPAEPERIERLSDEQLLEAVDQPAALVMLPDGQRRLLVLEPDGR